MSLEVTVKVPSNGIWMFPRQSDARKVMSSIYKKKKKKKVYGLFFATGAYLEIFPLESGMALVVIGSDDTIRRGFYMPANW